MLKTKIYQNSFKRDVSFLIVIILFFILFLKFFQLQILKYEKYQILADANRIRAVASPAPRGNIFTRYGRIIAANKSIYTVSLIKDELIDEDLEIQKLAEYLNKDKKIIINNLNKYYQGRYLPTLVAKNISIEGLSLIEEHRYELPGVFYSNFPIRYYPNKETINLSHTLGYLREINSSELKELGEDIYSKGDYIGFQGIEKYYEKILNGKKGINYHQVDALGREVGLMIDKNPVPSIPGKDIYLNIDYDLQSKGENLLDGQKGAIVIVDSKNGEILSLVSKPDFLLEDFSAGMDFEIWDSYSKDSSRPLFNRALQGIYPPGSSFKLLTVIIALENNLINPKKNFFCSGKYEFGDREFGCWMETGHGKLNLSSAIIQSCNVYFYEIAQMISIDLWSNYANKFNFGKFTNIDFPSESKGLIANRNYMNKKYGRWGWAGGSLLHLSIGQGDLLVTPLQMAVFASVLASKGNYIQPRIANIENNEDILNKIKLKESTWDFLHKTMFDVVNDNQGTAYDPSLIKLNIESYGKTGTAENAHGEPHAWFVGFAKKNDKNISLSIIVENSGTGGSIAAPISSKLIKEYFKKF